MVVVLSFTHDSPPCHVSPGATGGMQSRYHSSLAGAVQSLFVVIALAGRVLDRFPWILTAPVTH